MKKNGQTYLESIFSTIIKYTYWSEILFECLCKIHCPSRDHNIPGHLYLEGGINVVVCKHSQRNKQLKIIALKK